MILLATVALEPNRWTSRQSSLRLSDYASRARGAGFDGLELWENHRLQADGEERAKHTALPLPVTIYNSYAGFTASAADEAARLVATAEMAALQAGGLKWNVGNDPARRGEYLEAATKWALALPRHFRFLCECHPGTLLESPDAARDFLQELRERVGDGGATVGAIWHPLAEGAELAEYRCKTLAPFLDHAHIQARAENVVVSLAHPAVGARERLGDIVRWGYRGTYTIEFVPGTREPGENPEKLFEAACVELGLLKAYLHQG